jgi:predicted DNA-binding ribbon-helix-helix protein
MPSKLISKNVTVGRHRTSMRLEAELWDALADIAQRENMTVNDICTRVRKAHQGTGLTSAIRILLISYFRARSASPSSSASFDDLLGQTFTSRR